MIRYLMIVFFLGACSLSPESEQFIANIQGDYSDADKDNPPFSIEKNNGDFMYRNISYQFKEAPNETNAIYFLDDVQYVGIFFNPKNKQLRQVLSKNTSEDGIDFATNSTRLLGTKD